MAKLPDILGEVRGSNPVIGKILKWPNQLLTE